MSADQTDRAIEKKGETVTLRRKRQGVAAQEWPVKAKVSGYAAHEIDGTLVLVGDRKVIISALEVGRAAGLDEPKRGDSIVRDGGSGAIQSANKVRDGEVLDRYVLQVRGLPS